MSAEEEKNDNRIVGNVEVNWRSLALNWAFIQFIFYHAFEWREERGFMFYIGLADC